MIVVKEYFEYSEKWIKEYGEKTIVLMQVGSFFETYGKLDKDNNIFGSNINIFAEICEMTIARKNMTIGKHKIVMAGFGLAQLEKYIKKLQENGFTIVVYTQDSPCKNTTRSLHTIFSPGTYFSNETKQLSNNITCIWIHYSPENLITSEQINVGISNIDIYTGKSSMFEFSNNFSHNPTTYDELERYISIYNPNECILISNLSSSTVDDIITYTSINSNSIHKIDINMETELGKLVKNAEKQVYQREIIKRFFPKINSEQLFNSLQEYCIGIQAFVYLLDFVYKHNPHLINNISEPFVENYTDRLILANHSLKQLNMISDSRMTGKYASVSNLLNNCVSSMGKRQFLYNLLNPITNIQSLNDSYNITEHVLKREWKEYRLMLTDIRDLEKLRRKLVLKKITPKDISIMHGNLNIIGTLYKKCGKDKKLMKYFSERGIENIDKLCKKYAEDIERNLDIQKAKYIDDITHDKLGGYELENIFFINRGLCNNIDEYYKRSIESRQQLETIRKFLSDLIKKYEKSAKTSEFVKIHETAKMDPILLITKRRSAFLKKAIDELLVLSQSNNYQPTSGDLFSLSHSDKQTVFLKYNSNYSKKEEIIEYKLNEENMTSHGGNQTNMIINSPLIHKISSFINCSKGDLINALEIFYSKFVDKFLENDLEKIISFVIELDIIQCKCYIANEYNYCRPNIRENSEKSFIESKGLRHCLIEHLNQQEVYITNDLSLGNEKNGLLLYGTNAVGKTSLIRSIGIVIIMAQSGLYVPCSEFWYYPYKTIFTRILGNDNIFKGLSTFAVEMSELRIILRDANKSSLILGDELCSGTESDSALSIFVSGLEILHEKESTFLFATHFHEIVKYEEIICLDKLAMYHMSVIFDKENNRLIYDRKLKEGAGESMYGLEVCKSLNLPNEFLNRAHELRVKYNKLYRNILENEESRYNSKKIKNICELCKNNIGEEIHHLEYQNQANKNGFIKNGLTNTPSPTLGSKTDMMALF